MLILNNIVTLISWHSTNTFFRYMEEYKGAEKKVKRDKREERRKEKYKTREQKEERGKKKEERGKQGVGSRKK